MKANANVKVEHKTRNQYKENKINENSQPEIQ